MGGSLKNPTYKDVCTDKTGHAEVVMLEYDPAVITYDELLSHFWKIHDPTTLNRQGADYGTQYRSVIFYFSGEQKKAAEAMKSKLMNSAKYKKRKIVTEIKPAEEFYKAEEYHQKYFEKHGIKGCHAP